MRLLLLVQLALILFGTLAFSLNTWQQGFSFSIGGFAMLANVLLIAFVWDQLLRKKLIAVGVFIIVIKYAILGAVLYLTFSRHWVDAFAFSLGIGSIVLASVVYGLIIPSQMTAAKGSV